MTKSFRILHTTIRAASMLLLATPLAIAQEPAEAVLDAQAKPLSQEAAAPQETEAPQEATAPMDATAAPLSPAASAPVTWRTFQWTIVKTPFQMKYSRRGLELQTNDGRHTSRIRWRLQVRGSKPFDAAPRRVSQFGESDQDHLIMRRARFKVEGRLFGPLVNYKFEHDLVAGKTIDLYFDFKLKPWLKIRAGQWKSHFSQERVISSGSQQFAERSIVNREFTADRQSGAMLYGRLKPGTLADSSYFFEILGGSGINSVYQADSPMFVSRYQWNVFGREPEFFSSDLEGAEKPEAFIGISALRNRSRFTRFSTSGGGQLDGFAAGASNQYALTQVNVEFLLKYRGLSIQNENHWKNIRDSVKLTDTSMRGGYAQAGYFPHQVWTPFPKEVELAYRYAFVDSRLGVPDDVRQEHTVALNVFLEGHSNKFTIEAGRLSLARAGMSDIPDFRYRIQWDVHY